MQFSPLKLLTVALSCAFINPSHAAVMLSGGLSQDYNVQAGSTVNGTLQLKNTGNEPAEVKIYQEDVKVDANGSTEYTVGNGSHARSNANWISLSTDRVVLPAGASQSVPYTLQVPANGQLKGSYWSMIMLEPVSNKSRESELAQTAPTDKPSLTIHQKVRYAVQVLANVGQGAANLTFSPPQVARNEQGERVLSVDIRNQGDTHSRPKVWLEVFDVQGNSADKFNAETHGLYAGERETFVMGLNTLPAGRYKALLAAEDNNSGQVFGSDVNLTIQP